MIICTSTGAKEVALCMEHLGLSDYFVDIVSAEEKNFTKTEPDIYYYALEKLGTSKHSLETLRTCVLRALTRTFTLSLKDREVP